MMDARTNTSKAGAIVQALLTWFSENARDLPWRREPYCRDPYSVYVSEIMLQQTQVATVLPYWRRWMEKLPTIEALAGTSLSSLDKLWEGLGYYTRVRNMQKAAQVISEKHDGQFPSKYEDILELPGIGPYTAGAVCSIAFNQPRPILDGNVVRVLSRLYAFTGNPRERQANQKLWQLSEALVRESAHGRRGSARACSSFNQAMMELGALICTPRQPQCERCPVISYCAAHRDGLVEQLPRLDRRPRVTHRRFAAFVVQKQARFLVRQRPAKVINAHLWEFPNVELTDGIDRAAAARSLLGATPKKFKAFTPIKHSITRYRITLEVFEVEADKIQPSNGQWLSRRQMRRLPFCSAHKRILNLL